MDNKEYQFLLFYMEQTWNEMRHLENLRERVTVLIITIVSISIGFVVQQKFSPDTKVLIWLIILLGLLGICISLKLFQLHQMGQKRLDKWYSYMEKNCGESPEILKLRKDADQENKNDFKILSKIPHNYFWTTINIFIICMGLFMLTMLKETPSTTTKTAKTQVSTKTLQN